jgi:hypothetical protein
MKQYLKTFVVRHIEMGNLSCCVEKGYVRGGSPVSVPSIVPIDPYNSQETVFPVAPDFLFFLGDYYNPWSIEEICKKNKRAQNDNTDYGTFGDEDGNPL